MSMSVTIDESLLEINEHYIALSTPIPLHTLSSAICGSGVGSHLHFINRHVNKDYHCTNHKEDMEQYISRLGYNIDETIGMMTAVEMKDVSFKLYNAKNFSIFVVVTAGVGNAIDSSRAYTYSHHVDVGTINTWLFINGQLTDEAFVQSIITASEAKTKALYDLNVHDLQSNTIATGTSTDSILIAATQQGTKLTYAGTATPLGKIIGKAIYNETKKAILNTKQK